MYIYEKLKNLSFVKIIKLYSIEGVFCEEQNMVMYPVSSDTYRVCGWSMNKVKHLKVI